MEETTTRTDHFTEIPTLKVYTAKAIWSGTFLGGPLVAGYFMAENFKAFNDHDKAKKTWIIAIVVTVLLFGSIFLIPDSDKVPNHIIPLVYTGIAYYLVQHFQGPHIAEHEKNGGQTFNWKRTLIVSLIGLVTALAAIFTFSFVFAATSETSKTYGALQHEIVYDSSIKVTEVDRIAAAFEQTTFFDNAVQKFVYLEKIDNSYEISISCDHSVENNPQVQEPFVQLKNEMQKLIPNNKIVLKLVVESLDNVAKRIE